jgi:hypothetical protein
MDVISIGGVFVNRDAILMFTDIVALDEAEFNEDGDKCFYAISIKFVGATFEFLYRTRSEASDDLLILIG